MYVYMCVYIYMCVAVCVLLTCEQHPWTTTVSGSQGLSCGSCPKPLTVYHKGHIKGSIYDYIIHVIQLLMSGDSTRTIIPVRS